ncbi:MAG TPA: hypothetical protein VF723_05450 [Pyrinomonadaceae bacterium]
MRKVRPRFYEAVVSDGYAVEVIFFGVERGIPILYHVKCKPVIKTDGTVDITTERRECADGCSDSIFTVFLGRRHAIDEFLIQHPKFLDTLDLVDATRFLVTLEAVDSPKEVGLPVDIIRFDKSGSHWVQRKVECEDRK